MPQARAFACKSLTSGKGRLPAAGVGLPEKSVARWTDKAPSIFGLSAGAPPSSSMTSSRTTASRASSSRASSSTVISVLERASFTADAPLRSHCRAIQNTATAAVILDALMLNDAIVPDRKRPAGPGVSGRRLRRFDHVEQNAENILAHDPADTLDVGHEVFVDRDPFPSGRGVSADQRHLERRHALPCLRRFLGVEIAVGDMAGRIRRLNDGQ